MTTAIKIPRAVLAILALTLFSVQAAPAQETELFPGEVTEIVSGLDMPWGLTFLPDGTALVSERQSARILRIDPETGSVQELGVVPDMNFSAEGGLLGLAVSPSFEEDRTVFAYVSSLPTNRVVALILSERLDSFAFDRVVLDGIGTANRHHGGRLRFGPDGHLWIGTGDAFDPPRAQDRTSLNGKVLRINPDGSIPEDNPHGTPVFSIGHRNVQGLDFGPDGTLYASELGWNDWDELNVVRAGANYGWPMSEGPDGELGVPPIYALRPSEASPSGIAYAGAAIWMGTLHGQRLWRLPVRNGEVAGEPEAYFNEEYGRMRAVELAPDGSLWIVTSNTDGATLGGTPPRGGDDRILRLELVPR